MIFNKKKQFKYKKKTLTLVATSYVNFLAFLVKYSGITHILFMLGSYILAFILDSIFVTNIFFLGTALFWFLLSFVLKPFTDYSLNEDSDKKDQLLKFLKIHCSEETLKLFHQVKLKRKK